MTVKRIITSDLAKGVKKKVLNTISDIQEKNKASRIEKLEKKDAATANVLKDVDKIITSGKATQNPEKLLGVEKKKVLVDGKKVADVARSETVLVKTKINKPRIKKETSEEFLASWGIEKGSIAPKVLRDFNINKIETNDDIFKLIDLVSKSQSNKIFKFKRGVRSQKVTGAAADRLKNSEAFLAEVLGTKAGSTYNAEQILALRQLLVAGKNRLLYLANRASDDINSTADDVLAFRQHHALMAQMQKVLKGVQTETARALNQFKIPVKGDKFSFTGGNIDDLNKNELLVQLGGVDEIRNIAKLFISRPTSDAAMLKALEKTGLESYKQKTSNAIAEIFINSILSNPLTHMRNGLGNWITQAIVQQERKIASKYFSGGEGANYISPTEDIAKAWGKHMAAKEIMAAMNDTIKISGSKIEPKLGQVTSQNFNIKNKTGAAFFDTAGKVLTLYNLPTKFLQVSDDYFKNAEFRSEIYARAFSDGMEKYNKNLLKKADLADYIAGKVANPDKGLIEAAFKQAQYVTYQTPLGKRGDVFDAAKVGQTLKTYSANRGPWSWLTNYYLPFVRTPTNIAGFVAERTPVVAQLLTRYNDKIAQGGRVAAQAKAQLALGSMFYLATAPLGYYGVTKGSDLRGGKSKLTGGANLIQKTVKNEPFSLKLPIGNDKFQKISVRGFDPIAQMFAASANFGQMLTMLQGSVYNNITGPDAKGGVDGAYQSSKDALYYSIAFSFALGENLANSTMLSGAGKLVDDTRKITSGFYRGTGGQALKEVASEFGTSFIPTVFREGGKLFNDDFQKIATEFDEYAKRNIAEGDLNYDYDMRGRKFNKFSYFTQYEKDDLDRELESVFPRVSPIRNKIPFTYDVFGNTVSIPLKSDEKRFLRKNAGTFFNEEFKSLVEQDFYKNETRREIREGLIREAWQDAKKRSKEALLTDTDYDDGEGGTINFYKNIEQRANELAATKINNSQQGFIANDNINNDNQE